MGFQKKLINGSGGWRHLLQRFGREQKKLWLLASTPACSHRNITQLTLKVINNGVDTIYYDPGIIVVNKPPQILFVGRIVPQKNPLQIIHSLAEVIDLPWQCTIVGDGPLRRAIEKEADQLGIRERIEFTGWIAPEEVKEWFKRSDILFMPSLSEGLPVVGVQALSMGLAFVTGKVGGFVDLVCEVNDSPNGYLNSSNEFKKFAKSLRLLLENSERL